MFVELIANDRKSETIVWRGSNTRKAHVNYFMDLGEGKEGLIQLMIYYSSMISRGEINPRDQDIKLTDMLEGVASTRLSSTN